LRSSAGFTQEWSNFDLVVAEGVATVTLNRPARLNALTFEIYADLRDLLDELPHNDEVKSLILTGAGRGFCSGGDVDAIIGALQEVGAAQLLEFTRLTGAVVRRMREVPIPIIASLNGVAAGAGAVIALAADFRIMAESSSLQLLFTKVGLAGADMGAAYLLPRMVGLGRATEILLLGEPITPGVAERIGLATSVVPDSELAETARALARRLAAGPSFAYAATKKLVSRELDMDLASAVELEAWAQALLMRSHDHGEFYRSFVEKRAPLWEGR
jgi:enoyl-CoA hydratase/carnithine racemase